MNSVRWWYLTPCIVQIPEFIIFEDRLENSFQRDVLRLEHLRMRLEHEPISADIIDMELIELKFIFDRCTPFLCFQAQHLYPP